MKELCKVILRAFAFSMVVYILSAGLSHNSKAFAGTYVWVYSNERYTCEMDDQPYISYNPEVGNFINALYKITDLNKNVMYVDMGFKTFNQKPAKIIIWEYDFDANGNLTSEYDRGIHFTPADFDYIEVGSVAEKLWQAAYNRCVELEAEHK